jgi:hypothetical protein
MKTISLASPQDGLLRRLFPLCRKYLQNHEDSRCNCGGLKDDLNNSIS